MVERGLPASWAGKKLAGLNDPGRFWLTAVTRLGAARIVDTGIVGQEGDVLTFTAATDALDALTERLAAGKDH
ncbi:MAG: trk/ktr system potassium uptake protein [Actinomycetota bacterium]|nr:trk/ktr system potassium uptake protein [Actinomycetota bacterium]